MAAQLGYPLVQGSDLQSRNGRIGLRTVGGWVPVHVIMRRVDAGFCDPLELRSDSTLGIPGLTEACRARTVSVVNTLGSGVLENAGLGGLMSTLAKHLLVLISSSSRSRRGGAADPAGRSHVLAHLGDLSCVRCRARRSSTRSTRRRRVPRTSTTCDGASRPAAQRERVGQERLVPAPPLPCSPTRGSLRTRHRAAHVRRRARRLLRGDAGRARPRRFQRPGRAGHEPGRRGDRRTCG